MLSSSDPTLSVIIVTHNSMPLLKDCLSHLKEALGSRGGQVIIVDNCSSDHSATVAARIVPSAEIITNRTNVGFGAACNQAAGMAKGEFLLFLNPDLLIDSDAIDKLIEVVAPEERIGLAGARLRKPDGRFHPTCRRFPTIENMLYSRGSALSRIFRSQAASYTIGDQNETTIVEAVGGTAALIRRKTFEKMDGFDERYFMFVEDTDLCYRLNENGFVNVFVPQAGGVHFWGQGSRTGLMKRLYFHSISIFRFFEKFPAQGNRWKVLIMLTGNFLFAVLLMPFRRKERV